MAVQNRTLKASLRLDQNRAAPVTSIEFSRHRRAATIIADGKFHSHRVYSTTQVRSLGLGFELEIVAAEGRDLNFQTHAADDSFELEPASVVLFEGACRNDCGEGTDLELHIFGEGISPVAPGT